MTDYESIRLEYISGGISLRSLADRHGINPKTLMDKARRDGWSKDKARHQGSVKEKTRQKIEREQVKERVSSLERLQSIVDKLLIKTEDAVELSNAEARDIRQLTAAVKDLAEILGYATVNKDDERMQGGVVILPPVLERPEREREE